MNPSVIMDPEITNKSIRQHDTNNEIIVDNHDLKLIKINYRYFNIRIILQIINDSYLKNIEIYINGVIKHNL